MAERMTDEELAAIEHRLMARCSPDESALFKEAKRARENEELFQVLAEYLAGYDLESLNKALAVVKYRRTHPVIARRLR
jgi:hypothetical protein